MKIINKNNLLDFLISLCFFIFLVCFPIDLLSKNIYIIYSFQIIVRIIFIIYILLYLMFKKKLFVISIKSKLNDLFFIPFLLIVFNNLIFLLFKQKEVGFTYDFTFVLQIILTITVSISEELLFRVYIHSILNINNKILKIIISSLIFGLFHIVYFLSSFDPYDLIIIIYTFGLGLVLGFVYEFSENNFIYIIIIHFLFNFLNKDLFLRLFNGTNDYIFYIVSIIVSLITLIYGLLIYFMYFKNKKINN